MTWLIINLIIAEESRDNESLFFKKKNLPNSPNDCRQLKVANLSLTLSVSACTYTVCPSLTALFKKIAFAILI